MQRTAWLGALLLVVLLAAGLHAQGAVAGTQSEAPNWPAAAGWVIEWAPANRLLLAGNGLLATIQLDTGAETLLDELALTAALAPSGNYLAVAHADEIQLRAFPSNETLARLPTAQALALAWSPDGMTVAVGTEEGHLFLWEIESETELRAEPWADLEIAPPAAVTRLAFAANGRLLSVYADGRAVVWDLERRAALQRLDLSHDRAGRRLREARVAALAPDGGRVLATQVEAGQSEALLLDERNQILWRQPGQALEFSPDGTQALVLEADARAVLLLAIADGTTVRTFTPPASVTELYFARLSPDGARLVAVGEDAAGQVLLLWEVSTGRLLKTHR